jgi:putative oxidoreductase
MSLSTEQYLRVCHGNACPASEYAPYETTVVTERMRPNQVLNLACWLLRVALAAAFFSAVADRFGLWGPAGSPGVSWGNLTRFNAYVAKLIWFLPPAGVVTIGLLATAAETLLGLTLLIGWQLRWVALLSAILLFSFATAMLVALGPKAPLDYSVFTAASAAFLLFALQPVKSTPERDGTRRGFPEKQ